MAEYKKNCQESDYEIQINHEQHFSEYLSAKRMLEKARLSTQHEFEKESIDDYFTALQLISNAILLKKYKIRAKKSVCGYYKLYKEKILSTNQYEKLEKIREKRNLIHYDGYESTFIEDEEVKEIIKESETISKYLIEIYEGN